MDLEERNRLLCLIISTFMFETFQFHANLQPFIGMLLDEPKEQAFTREDRLKFYGVIEAQLEKHKNLAHDLNTVYKIVMQGPEGVHLHYEQIDLRPVIEEVVQKTSPLMRELVIDFEPEHIVAEVDAAHFRHILRDLLARAIQYAVSGSQVCILARQEPSPGSVQVGVQVIKGSSSKVWRKSLLHWDEFNVVKTLVEAHKGMLWTESLSDTGAIFWFRLPLQQAGAKE
ncbi:MAG TPA: hypothetical protein VFA07_17460 [Chthonomonadaceae bacterium]|nr:hypothetical protein [Chthonomonadaceae bacterium]